MKIIETNLEFAKKYAVRSGKPGGIVLHHAAGNGSVEDIHRYHRDANGWAGIGYHFYVRKDGKVYRGRPENWVGAHTTGHNKKLGICAEGNFQSETMSEVQKVAIIELIAHLQNKYGSMEVYGHRDLDASACPGKNYPFDEIVKGTKKENLVFDFQQAAIADSLPLNVYGADGIWGLETAKAASELVQTGSVGCRVRLIQKLVGADVDGIFGIKTHAAVRAYQSKKGLAVDGIVGINTWKALLGV